ncbi:hypothetical protein [Actinomadura hibisca]|uniref:hypothetical protein n=1 Tax=Actinomadura hibisca TaxID=68565 RepID=UPI00082E1D41|nr:hypothetical protein [Actinomadura hibisca]
MTAETPKDAADDVAETPAAEVEAAEEAAGAAGEPAPRPAKRKRRVRVIEVIEDDDEDLEDVLEALDAEEAEQPAARKPAAKASASAAKKATPAAATAAPAATAVKEREEPEPEPAPAPRPSGSGPKEPVSLDKGSGGSSLPLVPLLVGVVLVALLATLALWQWRTASGLSGTEDDRKEVAKVASDYGNLALNYNASNYQSQMEKAQKLMGGDLLENFKQCTLPNLGTTFKSQPQLALTSKTTQTFVGSVDPRFATATIAVDVGVSGVSNGSTPATNIPSNLIRLSLAKAGEDWKVTQQFPSGVNEQKRGCEEQLPGVPSGTNGEKPKEQEKKEEKPKN